MTEKQEKIISSALELFAEHGYNGTSTSKVAKMAGVSEGLIFRHFTNKEGLLKAIMEIGNSRVEQFYSKILLLENPTDIIKGVINLPFEIDESHYPFWKLIYALKWKSDFYDQSVSNPLREILIKAFTALKYSNPEAESDLVLVLIDSFATSVLLKKSKNLVEVKEVLLNKYRL